MPKIETHPPLGSPYNISIGELMSVVPPDERWNAGDDCVWSVAELPPVGTQERERRQIAPALSTLVRRYLEDSGFPALNERGEEVFGRYSVGEFTDDRELRFFLDHPAAIGPELVRRIQAMLAESFPLWRVVPQYEHLVLGVYPDGVWLGSQPDGLWQADAFVAGRPDDGDDHFRRWSGRVHELAETRLREQTQGEP